MISFNKKIYLEMIIIISISISAGIIKNIASKESLSLFSNYNMKLLDRSLYKTNPSKIKNPVEIDAENVMHLYENNLALIIDIRSLIKYKNGHIPTSINIRKNLDSLNSFNLSNSNRIIIIFTDESSKKLISKFHLEFIKAGVKNLLVYKKGIEDWIENGFPIEKSST